MSFGNLYITICFTIGKTHLSRLLSHENQNNEIYMDPKNAGDLHKNVL